MSYEGTPEKVLIVGYGNPLRSDDGAGHYIAGRLSQLNLPNVHCLTPHQLHLEIIEELICHDCIIFIDARESGPEIELTKVETDPQGRSSSHHLSPGLVASLLNKIYNKKPRLYLLTVRGESFDLGESLSPAVQERSESAIETILELLRERAAYA